MFEFSDFLGERIIHPFYRDRGFKSSDMRFATKRLAAASVSKPNSLLNPLSL
ncbi:MAG: hypothetical protein OXB86_00455 [Bdellovibrionales bacterium]|nr:hypothetical protein [Bdellovibrionales bacterium]